MYYVPVTDNYYKLPTVYIPVYSCSTDHQIKDNRCENLKDDLSRVQRDLANIREDLNDLRWENRCCRICSVSTRTVVCDETCSICYPCTQTCYRPSSPVHYCSICHDYVIDRDYPPPKSTPSPRTPRKCVIQEDDKLSEYLCRQLDLQRLRQRYIPQERPIWIPTAYKHDYPHRRWAIRHSNFSEP